jgi:hypothetical protein
MKHLSTIIGVLLCVCTLFHTTAAYGYPSQSTYSTEYTPTSYNQYTPYQYSYVPYPTSTPSYKEYEYLPLCALVCEDCLQCYRQYEFIYPWGLDILYCKNYGKYCSSAKTSDYSRGMYSMSQAYSTVSPMQYPQPPLTYTYPPWYVDCHITCFDCLLCLWEFGFIYESPKQITDEYQNYGYGLTLYSEPSKYYMPSSTMASSDSSTTTTVTTQDAPSTVAPSSTSPTVSPSNLVSFSPSSNDQLAVSTTPTKLPFNVFVVPCNGCATPVPTEAPLPTEAPIPTEAPEPVSTAIPLTTVQPIPTGIVISSNVPDSSQIPSLSTSSTPSSFATPSILPSSTFSSVPTSQPFFAAPTSSISQPTVVFNGPLLTAAPTFSPFTTAVPSFSSGAVSSGFPSFSPIPTSTFSSDVNGNTLSTFSSFPAPTSTIPIQTTIFF